MLTSNILSINECHRGLIGGILGKIFGRNHIFVKKILIILIVIGNVVRYCHIIVIDCYISVVSHCLIIIVNHNVITIIVNHIIITISIHTIPITSISITTISITIIPITTTPINTLYNSTPSTTHSNNLSNVHKQPS